MSEPFGKFVSDDTATGDGGKPAANPGHDAVSGNTGGIAEPEILYGYDAVDPAEFIKVGSEPAGGSGGDNPAGYFPDGRPRKRRARNGAPAAAGTKASAVPSSLIDLTDILLNIHITAATLLNVKELELDKTEAESLSKAIQEVTKHYPVSFDPKKIAIANLLITAGGIYGTRVMAYRMTHPKQPKQNGPQKVAQFPTQAQEPARGAAPEMAPSQVWPQAPLDLMRES